MAKANEKAGKPGGKAATKRPRRKRKPQAEEFVHWVVQVEEWDYSWWLRTSDPKNRWDTGPYSEIETLTLTGPIIRPEGSKLLRCEATFSARPGMLEEQRDVPPRRIGSATANEDRLEAYVFVPAERMAALAAIAQSGRLQRVSFSSTKLRYRSAAIHSVSVDTRPYEEEE